MKTNQIIYIYILAFLSVILPLILLLFPSTTLGNSLGATLIFSSLFLLLFSCSILYSLVTAIRLIVKIVHLKKEGHKTRYLYPACTITFIPIALLIGISIFGFFRSLFKF